MKSFILLIDFATRPTTGNHLWLARGEYQCFDIDNQKPTTGGNDEMN